MGQNVQHNPGNHENGHKLLISIQGILFLNRMHCNTHFSPTKLAIFGLFLIEQAVWYKLPKK